MLYDVYFRYDDEKKLRPFVINCSLVNVGYYVQRIANKSCVAHVCVDIKPYNPLLEFFEYTL